MVNKEDIKHVANLARLDLNVQEINKYSKDLSSVVDYIDQLKEVDTKDVEPTAQVTGMINQTRGDVSKDWDMDEKDIVLEQAKSKIGEEVRIKRVLN